MQAKATSQKRSLSSQNKSRGIVPGQEQNNSCDVSNLSTNEGTSIDTESPMSGLFQNNQKFHLKKNAKVGKKDLSEIRDLESDDEDNSNSSSSSSSQSSRSSSNSSKSEKSSDSNSFDG